MGGSRRVIPLCRRFSALRRVCDHSWISTNFTLLRVDFPFLPSYRPLVNRAHLPQFRYERFKNTVSMDSRNKHFEGRVFNISNSSRKLFRPRLDNNRPCRFLDVVRVSPENSTRKQTYGKLGEPVFLSWQYSRRHEERGKTVSSNDSLVTSESY